jgi:hypothetical protein
LLKRFRSFLFPFTLSLILLSFVLPASAQEDRSSDPDTSLGHLPDKILADLPHLFLGDNPAILAVGTGATAFALGGLDEQNSLAGQLQGWNTQSLFDLGNFYGEGWVEGLSAVGSWSIGALVEDPRLQEFGRDAAESLIDSTVLVTTLKLTINRERPDASNNWSFPSGHAIVAFCFAPVIQKYWGWEAGGAAYLLGTVTCLARVEGYHHYLSDVLAGATLGIVIGNAVVYAPKDVSIGVVPGRVELKLAFN